MALNSDPDGHTHELAKSDPIATPTKRPAGRGPARAAHALARVHDGHLRPRVAGWWREAARARPRSVAPAWWRRGHARRTVVGGGRRSNRADVRRHRQRSEQRLRQHARHFCVASSGLAVLPRPSVRRHPHPRAAEPRAVVLDGVGHSAPPARGDVPRVHRDRIAAAAAHATGGGHHDLSVDPARHRGLATRRDVRIASVEQATRDHSQRRVEHHVPAAEPSRAHRDRAALVRGTTRRPPKGRAVPVRCLPRPGRAEPARDARRRRRAR